MCYDNHDYYIETVSLNIDKASVFEAYVQSDFGPVIKSIAVKIQAGKVGGNCYCRKSKGNLGSHMQFVGVTVH